MSSNYPRGSKWRKWDLHVHTKGTAKNDQFKSATFEDFCVVLFKKALEKDISAIGITDYFSVENYRKVKAFVKEISTRKDFTSEQKRQIKEIFILPNVELRMLPVTGSGRLVNTHCLFNPDYVDSLENNFFGSMEHSAGPGQKFLMNRHGLIDLGKTFNASFDDQAAYQRGVKSFVVTHAGLQKLLDENRDLKENVIIAVSNSNKDGASGLQKHFDFFEGKKASSLEGVRRSIYRISDCIFSCNEGDVDYFAGKKTDDRELVKDKCGSLKPCIHGSDAHAEDKLFAPEQDKYCWIKADLTFEGLKQIKYEPESGERIKIGPVEPDQKAEYKVIRKIVFEETDDFPSEIVFNENLCSIIGSRSSGKSALLAYIAHSVNKELAEKMIPGPGKGEDYRWKNIALKYSIVWENGKSNEELQGNIVYIPQNHLFEISDKPNEIKEKIQPVLFARLPEFETKYSQATNNIKNQNERLAEKIDYWFTLADSIRVIDDSLKNLGEKKAVQQEKTKIEAMIAKIEKKHKLSKADLESYQKLSSQISSHKQRLKQIVTDLSKLVDVSSANAYFDAVTITLMPSLENLPKPPQEGINKKLQANRIAILKKANKLVIDYKSSIKDEKETIEAALAEIKEKNKDLIEKYQKNVELEALVKNLNEKLKIIKEIDSLNKDKKETQKTLKTCEKAIKSAIDQRKQFLEQLELTINQIDQTALEGIRFGLEYGFAENLENLTQKVNIKQKSDFLDSTKDKTLLNVEVIREKPESFLTALYTGNQRLNIGNDPIEVARESLLLTEKILFTAEMEQDKIGGFSESTMTPGKRALFALRLILDQSEDTWPLLIDQPEDDLDSRAIYNDIVPFLKKKKKERQIIMVSHNANLVIGSDSEQIIVANRTGDDRANIDGKQFNYLTGSIENTKEKDEKCKDTLTAQGIREHACEILDGGKTAFEHRRNKYNLVKA